MTASEKQSAVPSRYRRPVKVDIRHGRSSSGSSGSGLITLPPKATIASMNAIRGGQDKSLPPTPKAATETAASLFDDRAAKPENESNPLRQARSRRNSSHDDNERNTKLENEARLRHTDLEKALETARKEQQKMSEELQKIRVERDSNQQGCRLLQEEMARLRLHHEQDLHTLQTKLDEESKTSDYWSKKHQTTLTDLHGLKERWLERDEMWKHEWERKAAEVLEERDQLREKVHRSQRIAQVREEESEEARRQLLELKQNISTSTRTQSQITDHEVTDMMGGLNHEIQNWIVHNFRKSKNEISNLSNTLHGTLIQAVPLYISIISSSRLVVYQAFVIDRLMEIFEVPLFFGLPEEGPLSHVSTLANYLEPLSADFGQWRSLTLGIIDQDERGYHIEHTRRTLNSMQANIETTLSELTATEMTVLQRSSLRTILENAVKIARLVRRQHARFVFELPKVSAEREALFDGQVMEDVSGEEEEELKGRKVQCATFPAVYKLGDEKGDNMHLRNVIFKARVLCTQRSWMIEGKD